MFAIDFDIGDIVLEDGWDIDLLKGRGSVLSFQKLNFGSRHRFRQVVVWCMCWSYVEEVWMQ